MHRRGRQGASAAKTARTPPRPPRLDRTLVDHDADPLPWVWSHGTLDVADHRPTWLAVLVDGRVAAVAGTTAVLGQTVFVFNLPPSLVPSGKVDVEVARISGTPTAPVLGRCSLASG